MSEETEMPEPDVSAEHPVSDHWVWAGPHRPAAPRALVEHMTTNWAVEGTPDDAHPAAAFTRARREQLAARFPDRVLIIPTGNLKVRSNDTDYRFRPGTDFFYLTACEEPDAVLVIAPGSEAVSTLYVPSRSDFHSPAFYTDDRYGELWVGPRRGPVEAAIYYALNAAPLEQLEKDLAALGRESVAIVRGLDRAVDELRGESDADHELAVALNEMRLVKDDFEIAQLQIAVDATVRGFEDVVRALPAAIGRGERVVEGVFNLRARVEGSDVGYGVIAASGADATILHWTRNDGAVRDGDLLLLDAGVEGDNLYTADVTRTLPVNGTFSPVQRRVYELVLAAQEAGVAAVKPGASFSAPHEAAMAVLAQGLHDLGILTEEPVVALRRDRQSHRRYTLHGTSHMLGLDVHDCANPRPDAYHGELKEGYVLTVEPGLYFQENDLSVPEEYRGIGVRIEDDVLVTADGARNLSEALPRRCDDVEAWMRDLRAKGTTDLGL
jgi:Xaa-Pro aminopeptidase